MRSMSKARVLAAGGALCALVVMGGSANAADDDQPACDGIGALAGVNSAPLAIDDDAWVEPSGAIAIDVLANDVDSDGDALTISSVTPATHGEASVEDGKVVYEPGLGFEGEDSFSYHVDDGSCGTDQARVTIVVSNDKPDGGGEADPDVEPPVTTLPTFTG